MQDIPLFSLNVYFKSDHQTKILKLIVNRNDSLFKLLLFNKVHPIDACKYRATRVYDRDDGKYHSNNRQIQTKYPRIGHDTPSNTFPRVEGEEGLSLFRIVKKQTSSTKLG